MTLAEYGNAVLTTAKLRGTSYVDIDPIVANVVGYNAGVSIDTIARAALDQGTNVQYTSGLGATTLQSSVTTRAGVTSTNTISSLDIRVARAERRGCTRPGPRTDPCRTARGPSRASPVASARAPEGRAGRSRCGCTSRSTRARPW